MEIASNFPEEYTFLEEVLVLSMENEVGVFMTLSGGSNSYGVINDIGSFSVGN